MSTPPSSSSPSGPPDPPAEPDPLMERRLGPDRRRGPRRRETKKVDGDRRRGPDRRQGERRGAPRSPRNINQYDMSPEELEFVNAVLRFRQQTGNRFPTARDILRILRDLGYEKRETA